MLLAGVGEILLQLIENVKKLEIKKNIVFNLKNILLHTNLHIQ